jgi:hypothetical protein
LETLWAAPKGVLETLWAASGVLETLGNAQRVLYTPIEYIPATFNTEQRYSEKKTE